MSEKIGPEQALEMLKQAVAVRGEGFVYPSEERDGEVRGGSCRYKKDDGTGSCIIGVLAEQQGFLAALKEFRPVAMQDPVESLFSSNAVDLLRAAQSSQDRGSSWGSALQAASNVLANDVRRRRESLAEIAASHQRQEQQEEGQ